MAGFENYITQERLIELNKFFIRLRWIAVLVAGITVISTIKIFKFLEPEALIPLFLLVGLLFISNIIYLIFLRENFLVRNFSEIQMYVDLFILTVMLHFSGGIENPVSFAYIFHIILAGILFERKKCYFTVLVATALFAVMALAELMGLLHHYTLLIFPHHQWHGNIIHAAHSPVYVLSIIGMQFIVQSFTAYFTTAIMEQLKKRERDLFQSAKLAALGTIAAGIAHEVGNPLASLSTRIKLLEGRRDETFLKESLKLLQREIGRIGRIVHSISQSVKPINLSRSNADINQIIYECVELLKLHKHAKGIVFKLVLKKDLPVTMCIKEQLFQAFLNLGFNALEAMKEDGELTIRTENNEKNIEIFFEDTGPGITKEVSQRIFEPFFSTRESGLGLGLFIVKRIVDAHDGRIEIINKEGKGAIFEIILPIL